MHLIPDVQIPNQKIYILIPLASYGYKMGIKGLSRHDSDTGIFIFKS